MHLFERTQENHPGSVLGASLGAQRLLALAAAAPLALAAFWPAPARASEQFTGVYSIQLVGLSLGTATVKGQLGPDAYKIEAFAQLSGLAQAMSDAKGSAVSTGVIRAGRVAPNSYATTSANSKETRTVRMGLNAGNVRAVDIKPEPRDVPGRIAITEAHKRGVLDPLSALIMPVAGDGPMLSAAACTRTIPVFDGFSRFNIQLSYAGTRNVNGQGYKGQVAVCNVRYIPVAGHRPDRKSTQFMTNNKKMEVWLAPVNNSRYLVPYKISVATMMGTTVIEARRFQVSSDPGTASLRR
ncbi:MAG: DUF3108 domain-containing protein [Alphaproteobacteria bacterium]|nr:DUF3108 domain-containing protein [Alphaproteobacteria bacterium]